MYITNAFNIGMLRTPYCRITVTVIPLTEAKELAPKCVSAIGDKNTAALYSDILGHTVKVSRITLGLLGCESILVGPHLPAGASSQWRIFKITARPTPVSLSQELKK